LPVLLGVAGFAVDATHMVNTKLQLQDGLDAAALSAASSLNNGHSDITAVKTYALNVLLTNMSNSLSATELTSLRNSASIVPTPDTNTKSYTVVAKGTVTLQLTGLSSLLGFTQAEISASSTSQSQSASKNAMSMYVVLDRSGSMSFKTTTLSTTQTRCANYTEQSYPRISSTSPCYVNKMAALKTAAATLFDQLDALESADTTNTLVRVGSVSFTDSMQSPQALAWGTASVRTYVTALPAYPSGGTDMTDAMATAYDALTAPAEVTAQAGKNNATFSKFIVLMTDGENTGASTNWNPSLDAETRTTCTAARNAGITIYTIAFMAPPNGQAMLQSCAGTLDNYFQADDMASLVSAFKEIGEKATDQTTRLLN
jgi:Flp pilus assembly protein TadG